MKSGFHFPHFHLHRRTATQTPAVSTPAKDWKSEATDEFESKDLSRMTPILEEFLSKGIEDVKVQAIAASEYKYRASLVADAAEELVSILDQKAQEHRVAVTQRTDELPCEDSMETEIFLEMMRESEQCLQSDLSQAKSTLESARKCAHVASIGVEKAGVLFSPGNMMGIAQRDILGDRGVKNINVNGRDLIKSQDSGSGAGTEIGGLLLSYTYNTAKGVMQRTEPSVSLCWTSTRQADGSYLNAIQVKNILLSVRDLIEVKINGYVIPNCTSIEDIQAFLSVKEHFQKVMGSVLALRILNAALPDGTTYDRGCDLFHEMLEKNPKAAEIFLLRTCLIEQRMPNAVTNALGMLGTSGASSKFIWSMKDENYSVMVTKSTQAAARASIPAVDSQEFTELIQNFRINLSLSCDVKAASLDPRHYGPHGLDWHQTGFMRYSFDVSPCNEVRVTEIILICQDGQMKAYSGH